MANTILLPVTVSSDHGSFTITDNTIYTSPARLSVGVFVSCKKVDYRGGEANIVLTPDTESAANVSVWTADLTHDGHYRIRYVAIPNYSAGVTYAKYDVAYDTVNYIAYKSIVAGNIGNALTDTAYWSLLLDPASIVDNRGYATESLNLSDSSISNILINTLTSDKRDVASLAASVEFCADSNRYADVSRFMLLDTFVAGLSAAETNQEFSKGERIARRAEAL